MKNKNTKGVIIIDGKEKWEVEEVKLAWKLILQKFRKVLESKTVKRHNLDAFGNSDIKLSTKLCKEMCSDVISSLDKITLPKKYANNRIYKECLDAFKKGWKKI